MRRNLQEVSSVSVSERRDDVHTLTSEKGTLPGCSDLSKGIGYLQACSRTAARCWASCCSWGELHCLESCWWEILTGPRAYRKKEAPFPFLFLSTPLLLPLLAKTKGKPAGKSLESIVHNFYPQHYMPEQTGTGQIRNSNTLDK